MLIPRFISNILFLLILNPFGEFGLHQLWKFDCSFQVEKQCQTNLLQNHSHDLILTAHKSHSFHLAATNHCCSPPSITYPATIDITQTTQSRTPDWNLLPQSATLPFNINQTKSSHDKLQPHTPCHHHQNSKKEKKKVHIPSWSHLYWRQNPFLNLTKS